jgi:hypothetical protein
MKRTKCKNQPPSKYQFNLLPQFQEYKHAKQAPPFHERKRRTEAQEADGGGEILPRKVFPNLQVRHLHS